MKLWLTAASSNALQVDHLLLALSLISCDVLALVFGLMLLYMFKYRAGSDIDRGALAQKTWRVEAAWTAATLVAFFGLFIWGARLYVLQFQPPPNALKIYVIGKQFMWTVEHDGGVISLRAPENAKSSEIVSGAAGAVWSMMTVVTPLNVLTLPAASTCSAR